MRPMKRFDLPDDLLEQFDAMHAGAGQRSEHDLRVFLDRMMPSSSDRERKKALSRYIAKLEKNIREKQADRDAMLAALDAWKFVQNVCNTAPVFQRPTAPISHHVREAIRNGTIINERVRKKREGALDLETEVLAKAHYFLVQHDWASAFRGAGEYEGGEFRLPFEVCVFEFLISGHRMIVPAIEWGDDVLISPIMQTPRGWFSIGIPMNLSTGAFNMPASRRLRPLTESEESNDGPEYDVFVFIADQIKAVCVALEAQVAEAQAVSAPAKLNRARVKAGKPEISDHHVVYLSRRGTSNRQSDITAGTKKRLHFRRGHWRHYEDRRTWVRWTLVGNPDLGFVDKEYRF